MLIVLRTREEKDFSGLERCSSNTKVIRKLW
jgi:hypothetical protein